ncbi:Similar to TNXB: Tenascin-X (Homo sapiens) [Cotesia congregata]|uniref:Similar to TNXB: Tenascin-X (Homo sapiens) n=1 Tax=Cotesia congregata TaxID=51543 RepID=A0A8J2EHP2_COTCN|nr:Similar to TNXB: Tenascin-X (Homo sapiens) [Cotesia congregata]
MNKKISVAGGLALLFIVNAVQKDALNQCANFGDACGLDLKRHCCDDSLKCAWSHSATEIHILIFGSYLLGELAILGGNCRTNEDCNYVLHSTCSSGICVCRQNNIRVSETKCMPLLNEFCWKEQCAPDNSLYSSIEVLMLSVMLGASCRDDEACTTIKFATCASNGTCACSERTVMIGPMLCSLLLEDTCGSNSECRVPNSECIDQKCQCKLRYIVASRAECKNAYVGMYCEDSSYCHSNIDNTQCVGHRCECSANYGPKNGNECLSLSRCDSDSDCKLKNFKCIDNECQCKPNYLLQEIKCLPRYLGGLCEVSSDCINIDYAVCKRNECTCENGFFPINRSQCGRGLTVECSKDEECIIINSQCMKNKCRCRDGYTQSSAKFCLPSEFSLNGVNVITVYANICTITEYFQGFCSTDDQCKSIPNSHCSKNNQCICRENAQQSSSACAPSLNQSCSIANQCITENSMCIDNVCQCRDGYISESNDKCIIMTPLSNNRILEYSEKSCVVSADCTAISNAMCSNKNKCVCKPHYVRSEQFKCSLQLEAYCQQDGDCITKNLTCFDEDCRCPKEFFQVSDNLCARGFIGQFCSADEDCDMITNGRCSEEKMCACKSGYAKFDALVCLPLIGEYCNEHKDCYVYNSNCVDNKCQCLENHMPLSNTKCLSKYVSRSCYDNVDCLAINYSHCSRYDLCVCNHNYMVDKRGFCKPALNGHCLESLQCQIANSQCINSKCQCMKNFVSGIYNNCIPSKCKIFCEKFFGTPLWHKTLTPVIRLNVHDLLLARLGKYCTSDGDCAAIKFSHCTGNKCVCKKNYETVDNAACKPLLNCFCTTDKDCIVENSYCIDNKCKCKPDYAMQSLSRCEPRVLGQTCETDSHCSFIQQGKCSPDNICVCSLDTFALDNKTCSPLLNTFCQFNEYELEFSHCVDYKYQCKLGYTAISSSQCINSNLLEPCERNDDCLELWHFECSKEKKCVCKADNVAVGNSTCLPLLGGICWQDDQCRAENSLCDDYHCRCKPNFISVASNKCVPDF